MIDLTQYKLIAISGKQYTGKDVLAGIIQKHFPQFKRIPLAFAIKEAYAKEHGLTVEEVEANKAHHRPGLIAKGNWGRDQDPDYWLKQVLAIPGAKIVPDVRLKREYHLLQEHGAFLIRVNTNREIRAQRGTVVSEFDKTECDLDDITDWNLVLENNGSMEALEQHFLESLKLAVQV